MAQEFKEYDKKFSKNKGKTFKNLGGNDSDIAFYQSKNSWYEFMPTWRYTIHGREDIRHAVYKGDDAEAWQKFRVGLHGLTTRCKLWCLMTYYLQDRNDYAHRIRVDNYLGALIRGGQLNDKLEVLK